MLKKIERPYWPGFFYGIDDEDTGELDNWFDEHIEPLNKLIENAVEVTGKEVSGMDWYFKKNTFEEDMTHRGWVIGIEPIKQETCADVLREALLLLNNQSSLYKRAKAALERERDGKND